MKLRRNQDTMPEHFRGEELSAEINRREDAEIKPSIESEHEKISSEVNHVLDKTSLNENEKSTFMSKVFELIDGSNSVDELRAKFDQWHEELLRGKLTSMGNLDNFNKSELGQAYGNISSSLLPLTEKYYQLKNSGK